MGLFITMEELDLIAQFEADKNYFNKKRYLRKLNELYEGRTRFLADEDMYETDEFLPPRVEADDELFNEWRKKI